MRYYYRIAGGAPCELAPPEFAYWLWCMCAEPGDRHPRWLDVQLIAVEL